MQRRLRAFSSAAASAGSRDDAVQGSPRGDASLQPESDDELFQGFSKTTSAGAGAAPAVDFAEMPESLALE